MFRSEKRRSGHVPSILNMMRSSRLRMCVSRSRYWRSSSEFSMTRSGCEWRSTCFFAVNVREKLDTLLLYTASTSRFARRRSGESRTPFVGAILTMCEPFARFLPVEIVLMQSLSTSSWWFSSASRVWQ